LKQLKKIYIGILLFRLSIPPQSSSPTGELPRDSLLKSWLALFFENKPRKYSNLRTPSGSVLRVYVFTDWLFHGFIDLERNQRRFSFLPSYPVSYSPFKPMSRAKKTAKNKSYN